MIHNQPEVRVLHIDRSGCPEGKICPAVLEVEGMPGHKAIVGRFVSNPAVAAALHPHVGPGEGVLLIPDALYDQIRGGSGA